MKKIKILLRRTIYLLLGTIDTIFSLPRSPITILCYHSIASDSWDFSIGSDEFVKQIKYLATHYNFISLSDLRDYLKNHKKIPTPSIILTFDDGYRDILQVTDFLNSMNITPTLFVLSNGRNAVREELDTNKAFLTNKEILQLAASGWEIGCHTATHPNMYLLSPGQLRKETIESKTNLENKLGSKIQYFAYPCGQYNLNVVDHVQKAGFKLAVTMDDHPINSDTNPLLIPRVGIVRNHSFSEFKVIFSPSVIRFREFIKTSCFKKLI